MSYIKPENLYQVSFKSTNGSGENKDGEPISNYQYMS